MKVIETTVDELKNITEKRPEDSHKGTFGRVLLICGSRGMAGAAVLCAKASLRSGAGLVTAAVPGELFHIIQTAVPEATCIDRDDLLSGERATESLFRRDIYDAVAIGCGMGPEEETFHMVRNVVKHYWGPVIIDADGINSICRFNGTGIHEDIFDMICRRQAPVIMTPHPGEAGRLLQFFGYGRYGDRERAETAEVLAEISGASVVLKGHETLIAFPKEDGVSLYINRTGNPGMATGGSGDVLTGVITALQGGGVYLIKDFLVTIDPLRVAVYIHGRAGDLAAEELGETGMTAMDIVEKLPEAFREIIGD